MLLVISGFAMQTCNRFSIIFPIFGDTLLISPEFNKVSPEPDGTDPPAADFSAFPADCATHNVSDISVSSIQFDLPNLSFLT